MSEIVWTKHATQRNKERQISTSWVEQTINNPDNFREVEDGKSQSRKKFGSQTVTVISAKTKEGKYLVLSSWINPPSVGSSDYKNKQYYNHMKKASLLRKFWFTFLHQIGL